MWQTCDFMNPNGTAADITDTTTMTTDNNNNNNDIICNTPSYTYDPFDRNIVGPRSCEYCHASTTAQCTTDCPRPKLFFQRKRPPFVNARSIYDDDYIGDALFHTRSI